jgi:hypothetical protein
MISFVHTGITKANIISTCIVMFLIDYYFMGYAAYVCCV